MYVTRNQEPKNIQHKTKKMTHKLPHIHENNLEKTHEKRPQNNM